MADAWFDMTPVGEWPWEGCPPGPQLARVLAAVDPRSLPGQARVSHLAACEALVGWAQMQSAHAMVATAEAVENTAGVKPEWVDSQAEQWVAEEIAAALHVATSTATARVHVARDLTVTHPRLGVEVLEGRLTMSQARVIAEGLAVMEEHRDDTGHQLSEQVLDQLLATAGQFPPSRLRDRVRTAVIRLAPDAIAKQRKRTVREQTQVSYFADAEVGTAYLGIRGSSVDMLALRDAVRVRAREMKSNDAEVDRTSGQWQVAAVMTALGVTPSGMPASPADADSYSTSCGPLPIGIGVQVVMDLPTALGLAENPAIIPGYGPIDPELAQQLACDGEWRRWVTDPIDGHLLDDGDRRFPGARLRRFLKARDPRCDLPPCGRTAHTDADHTPVYRESRATSAATMSTACTTHNRGRDAAGWSAEGDGRWRSALGRVYQTRKHEVLMTFHSPDGTDPPPF